MEKYNATPKCNQCGKFIPWTNTEVIRIAVRDMQHDPCEDDVISGFCDK
jgi:hypothetical protein